MSYIIVFDDRSKIQVSDEVGERIKAARRSRTLENFEIGRSQYSEKSIRKIITKEEAYDTYPTEWEMLKEMADAPTALKLLE